MHSFFSSSTVQAVGGARTKTMHSTVTVGSRFSLTVLVLAMQCCAVLALHGAASRTWQVRRRLWHKHKISENIGICTYGTLTPVDTQYRGSTWGPTQEIPFYVGPHVDPRY